MEQYFATIFEGVRHERSLIILLSFTDPNMLKQNKFTDHEINVKKSCCRKITERILKKKHVAVSLME